MEKRQAGTQTDRKIGRHNYFKLMHTSKLNCADIVKI